MVIFEVPRRQWLSKIVAILLLWLVSSMLFAAIFWAGITSIAYRFAPSVPWWWHLIGAAGLLVIVFALLALGKRELLRRIMLGVDAVHFQGWLGGGRVSYDSISLLRLILHPKSPGLAVEITRAARSRTRIWLTSDDARECFDALRALCDHAPAIALDGQAFLPQNPTFNKSGELILACEQRRTAIRNAALALLGIIGCIAFFVVLTRPAAMPAPGTMALKWRIAVIGYPAIAVILAGFLIQHTKRALGLHRKANALRRSVP